MSDLKAPQHIAIIMDGNNRWARKNSQNLDFAYRKGSEVAEKVINFCINNPNIYYLTLYAFSIENWNRPANEIELIMSIFYEFMLNKLQQVIEQNIKILFIGNKNKIQTHVLEMMEALEQTSKTNNGLQVIIAMNYGSKQEILEAAFNIKNSNNFEDYCTAFAANINKYNIPDPDLLIRTSGELRLSNFLLWQLAYTELYFTNILWPDFDEIALQNAIDEYKSRNRRFGTRLKIKQ